MSQFMLFIRGGSASSEHLSPQQIQEAIERYRAWAQNCARRENLSARRSSKTMKECS